MNAPNLPWINIPTSSMGIRKGTYSRALVFGYEYFVWQKNNGKWISQSWDGHRLQQPTEDKAKRRMQEFWEKIWDDQMEIFKRFNHDLTP